jgi:hypothetical protein
MFKVQPLRPEGTKKMNPGWKAQLFGHLRAAGKRLGFLINFK